jgi:hypothetical protein
MHQQQQQQEVEDNSMNPAEIDNGELQHFKQNVNRWCELDSKIKQYEQVVKAHKKMKDELCGNILQFMEGYDISDLKTPFGKLQKVESFTKAPLTKALICDKIQHYFHRLGVKNGKEQSDTLVSDLYDNRERKKTVRLKRIATATATAAAAVTSESTTSKSVKSGKSAKSAKSASTKQKVSVPERLKQI